MGLGTLLFFSVLMVVVPLGTFFSAKQGRLDGPLGALVGQGALESNRLVVAGLAGVAAVNLVVATFVVVAWLEPPLPPRGAKQD